MDNYYEHFDHFSFPIFVTVWQFEPMLPTLGFVNAYNSKLTLKCLFYGNVIFSAIVNMRILQWNSILGPELYGVILVLCRIWNCIALSLEAVNK